MMKALLVDTVGVAGVGLLGFGSWQVYEPAGFIVTGALLLGYAVFAGRAT